MVKKLCSKRSFLLAITLFVVANLSLGSQVFAKQLEIKAADVERIKTALGMAQTVATVSDIIINNKDLATVLNTIIGGGKTGVDVTYGLVVLGALNEMDLVDLVVSGRYRDEAREYFNSVLNQTIDLTSYWQGTSQNIFSLMRRGGAVTPTTGLATESIAILEKTMSVIVSAKVWLQVETYNGMWRYFQDRMNGDAHEDAWYFAEGEMGYVPEQVDSNKLEGWLHDTASYREKQIIQLEQQFLALYNNWEPYVTPFGISEEYKKQVKEELNNTLVAALKTKAITAEKFKPSFVDRLYNQLEKLKNDVITLISQINPFKAGVALNLPEDPEKMKEAEPLSFETGLETEPIVEEIQEDLDDVSAEAELIEVQPLSIEPLLITTTTTSELPASTTESVPLPEPESPPAPEPKPAPTPGPVFCERDSGNPTRFRVLINEVAWMGTTNSTNDEWIVVIN